MLRSTHSNREIGFSSLQFGGRKGVTLPKNRKKRHNSSWWADMSPNRREFRQSHNRNDPAKYDLAEGLLGLGPKRRGQCALFKRF